MTETLVVILTALDLEYQAVRQKLVDPQVRRHERGTRFEIGTLRATQCRVARDTPGRAGDWTDHVPAGTRAPKVHFGAIAGS